MRAKGSVLFPCDQDDVWNPVKIETMVGALDGSPGSGAAVCNSSLIDAYGRTLPGSFFELAGLDAWMRGLMEAGRAMLQIKDHNVVASHAIALRRSALDLVLPLGPTPHADCWIALILGATTGITVVDDRLVAYRLHETNTVGISDGKVRLAERVSAPTAARFSSRGHARSSDRPRRHSPPGRGDPL